MPDLNPFYFIVVVWGQRFRDYLTHYCIPSLLAPNNIPALANQHHNKFLICTTQEDWQQLQITPVFEALKRFVEPVFLEIPLPSAEASPCQHMGIGHKLATERCFKDGAYGVALTPDLLVSDGTIDALQQQALKGMDVVLCPAIRFAEEPFVDYLDKHNIQVLPTKATDQKKELCISSRQLVDAAMHSFHSHTASYDFFSAHYEANAPVSLYCLPNKQGMLIHSLSWCPLLLNYSAIKHHDVSCLEQWTMDGDYVYKNFKDWQRIYVCQDSDEIMMVSWSPLAYQKKSLKSGRIRRLSKKWSQRINQCYLQNALMNPVFDPLKVHLFSIPVKWHVNEIDETWSAIEREAQHFTLLERGWKNVIFDIVLFISHVIKRLGRLFMLSVMLFVGSQKARHKLKQRLNLWLKLNREV